MSFLCEAVRVIFQLRLKLITYAVGFFAGKIISQTSSHLCNCHFSSGWREFTKFSGAAVESLN